MVSINGKQISDALTEGMRNNGLPWLARFNYRERNDKGLFLNVNEPIVFDPSIKRSHIPSNVKYIPYKDCYIAFADIKENDFAISGHFTGCYMGTYWDKDRKYVCHIATGGGAGDQCLNEFSKIEDYSKIKFKPSLIVNEDKNGVKFYNQVKETCKEKGYIFNEFDDIYGIITYDDEFYSFIAAEKDNHYFVIAWAKWRLWNGVQELEEEISLFDELVPYLAHSVFYGPQ